MTERAHNFGPGPSALPLSVLERVREELLDFDGTGMSILESSHRGPAYSAVHERTIELLRELLGGAADHEILFMGGGARSQFSIVPMNLLRPGGHAAYLTTGRWSEMAQAAAAQVGEARELWSSSYSNHDHVPESGDYAVSPKASYLHYTSNNTIVGTQYPAIASGGEWKVPLVCDMSSDICSRPVDLQPFGLIYAGAQKNIGCAGVTLVLVRKDLLERSPSNLPAPMSYASMAAKNSLLNTPPVFSIYVLGLVAEHLLGLGGLEAVARRNEAKASHLYSTIDGSGGFYRGHAREDSRSRMNVTFRLPSEDLEKLFLEEATAENLVGLKGHRSVGGLRASIYNNVEPKSVDALVSFMEEFRRRHG